MSKATEFVNANEFDDLHFYRGGVVEIKNNNGDVLLENTRGVVKIGSS